MYNCSFRNDLTCCLEKIICLCQKSSEKKITFLFFSLQKKKHYEQLRHNFKSIYFLVKYLFSHTAFCEKVQTSDYDFFLFLHLFQHPFHDCMFWNYKNAVCQW